MSLATKAARGALWTVFASIGGRAVGVIGTLVMTRFLAPDVIGEVADATILCMTLNWITIWGFGQYAVVYGRGPDATEVTWHATVFYVVLGLFSFGVLTLLGPYLTPLFGAPEAYAFIPGMAFAIFIRRIGAVPERVLTRQMNFRATGLGLMLGEFAFMASSIAFAATGHGGMSIVYGNIIQSIVVVGILIRAVGFASWATPTPLRKDRIVAMLKFGVPLGVQGIAHSASRYWDKLAISHFFGTGAVGTYNMAYNLADIPAIQVGEQIALVLMPSMATLPRERRPAALERSSALLSLVIFPLAIGLGLVAYPLIALLLPANDWQEVAPLLAVLTTLSVFRPITWVMSAFLEAEGKTNRLMFLEVAKVALLLAGIVALQPLGLRAAAGAVGIAFGVTAAAGVLVVVREGVSPVRLLAGFVQPLVACGVMALAVTASRLGLYALDLEHPAIVLVVDILVGATAYVVAALHVARTSALDLLRLVRQALRRREVA
ncbi:MAG: oligosaccharide flippase family protein [Kofleriaceae bacterium]|nr:oligosaccharide flippase family protein [Kofleriaceae bacterium]